MLDFLGGPYVITGSLNKGKSQKMQCQSETQQPLLALRTEGGRERRAAGVLEAGKGEEMDPPPRVEGTTALPTP